ncbi:hypothetical protein [Streptomyces sp. NPDC058145]|uniref:hypothetical protein n=1 Tax=Streptomyces sp. NPDC058145 TaxID=3346356 RepID=UPI0036E6A624
MATAFGRGAGLSRLSDLVEYQLTRPTPARDRLAALLSPLAERPEMLRTLRVLLACGLDCRRAAARLQVHLEQTRGRLAAGSRLAPGSTLT